MAETPTGYDSNNEFTYDKPDLKKLEEKTTPTPEVPIEEVPERDFAIGEVVKVQSDGKVEDGWVITGTSLGGGFKAEYRSPDGKNTNTKYGLKKSDLIEWNKDDDLDLGGSPNETDDEFDARLNILNDLDPGGSEFDERLNILNDLDPGGETVDKGADTKPEPIVITKEDLDKDITSVEATQEDSETVKDKAELDFSTLPAHTKIMFDNDGTLEEWAWLVKKEGNTGLIAKLDAEGNYVRKANGQKDAKEVSIEQIKKDNPEIGEKINYEEAKRYLQRKTEQENEKMAEKNEGLNGTVRTFLKKHYYLRTAAFAALSLSANALGGQGAMYAVRGLIGAAGGREAGKSLWAAKNLKGMDKEYAEDGSLDAEKMSAKIAEIAATEGGQDQLIEMMAKGEIKFSEFGAPISKALNEKTLEEARERESKAGFLKKEFFKLKNKWQGMNKYAKFAITAGVFVGGALVAAPAVGGGLVGSLLTGTIGTAMGAMNVEAKVNQATIDDSEVLESIQLELYKDKTPEEIAELTQRIQDKSAELTKKQGKWGVGGAIVMGLGANALALFNSSPAEASTSDNTITSETKLDPAKAIFSATDNTIPEGGYDNEAPIFSAGDQTPSPEAADGKISDILANNAPVGDETTNNVDKVFQESNLREGSSNLHDELILSEGKLDASPGGGARFVHKMIEGLAGKNQLEGMDQKGLDNLTEKMIEKMQSEGTLNSDGSIKDYAAIKDFNPYDYAHKVLEEIKPAEPVAGMSEMLEKANPDVSQAGDTVKQGTETLQNVEKPEIEAPETPETPETPEIPASEPAQTEKVLPGLSDHKFEYFDRNFEDVLNQDQKVTDLLQPEVPAAPAPTEGDLDLSNVSVTQGEPTQNIQADLDLNPGSNSDYEYDEADIELEPAPAPAPAPAAEMGAKEYLRNPDGSFTVTDGQGKVVEATADMNKQIQSFLISKGWSADKPIASFMPELATVDDAKRLLNWNKYIELQALKGK